MNTNTEIEEVEAPQGFDDPESAEDAETEDDGGYPDDNDPDFDDSGEEAESEIEDNGSEEKESEGIQESFLNSGMAHAAGATALVVAAVAGLSKLTTWLNNKYGMGTENYVRALESQMRSWKQELSEVDEHYAETIRDLGRNHEDEMRDLKEEYKRERRYYTNFIKDMQDHLDKAKAAVHKKQESVGSSMAKHAGDVAKTVTGGATAGIIVTKAKGEKLPGIVGEEASKKRKSESAALLPISMIDAYKEAQENHVAETLKRMRSSIPAVSAPPSISVPKMVGKAALAGLAGSAAMYGGIKAGQAINKAMKKRKSEAGSHFNKVLEKENIYDNPPMSSGRVGIREPNPEEVLDSPHLYSKSLVRAAHDEIGRNGRVRPLEHYLSKARKNEAEASDMNRFGVNSAQGDNEPIRESLASQRAGQLPSHLTASNFPAGSFSLHPQAAIPVSDDPMSLMWATFNQHRAHAARGL